MSGTNVGPPPRTDAELARDLVRRSEALENPDAARAGDWVWSTGADGALVASYNKGGNIVVATPPDAESDPDAVVPINHELPYIKVRKKDSQPLPAGSGVYIDWDTVDAKVGGWGLPLAGPFNELIIPKSGLYLMVLSGFFPISVAKRNVLIQVDGVVVQDSTWPDVTGGYVVDSTASPTATDVRFLGVGTKVQGEAYSAAASAIGPDMDTEGFGYVYTSFSIVCLRELALGSVTE